MKIIRAKNRRDEMRKTKENIIYMNVTPWAFQNNGKPTYLPTKSKLIAFLSMRSLYKKINGKFIPI